MSAPLAFATNGLFGGGGTAGTTTVYRMRAKDTTLNEIVYWSSSDAVDATGAKYTGPGPLTDIVVASVVGQAV